MAINIIASQGAGSASYVASVNVSIDFGSAAGRAIAVSAVGYQNAAGGGPVAITSVVVDPGGANITLTGNGVTTSTATSNFYQSNTSSQEYVFAGDSLPTGVKTVRLTMANANSKPQLWVTTLNGVASIRGATALAWGLSTAPSASITSAVGDVLMAHVRNLANLADGATVTPTSPATAQRRIPSTESLLVGAVLQRAGAAGATAVAATLSTSDAWGVAAWSFVPTLAPDTTAPTLTGPTGTSTGSTTASGTVSTDEAGGTLYRLASTNATESEATVRAAALTSSVTATGTQAVTFTGLTASTTYYAHYVHTDPAGNDSARVSSASFTTSAAGDTTEPTQAGAITVGTVTSTSIQFSWPAGADNVGVVGYDVSSNSGSTWTTLGDVLTHTFSGLSPSTTYGLRVRPRDAAGNDDSTPLAVSQATLTTGRILFTANPADVCREFGSGSAITGATATLWIHNATTGVLVAQKSVTTDGSGLFGTVSDGAMALSTNYRVDFKFDSGEYGVVYKSTEAT